MSNASALRVWMITFAVVVLVLLIAGTVATQQVLSREIQRQKLASGGTIELVDVLYGKHLTYDPTHWWERLATHLPKALESYLAPSRIVTMANIDSDKCPVLAPVLRIRDGSPFVLSTVCDFSDGRSWRYSHTHMHHRLGAGSDAYFAPAVPLFPRSSEWLDMKVFDRQDSTAPIATFRFRNPAYRSRADKVTSSAATSVTEGDLQFKLTELQTVTAPKSALKSQSHPFGLHGMTMSMRNYYVSNRRTRVGIEVVRQGRITDQWEPRLFQFGDRHGGEVDITIKSAPFEMDSMDPFSIHVPGSGQEGRDPALPIMMKEAGLYEGEGPFSVKVGFGKSHGFESRELWTVRAEVAAASVTSLITETTNIAGGNLTFAGIGTPEKSLFPGLPTSRKSTLRLPSAFSGGNFQGMDIPERKPEYAFELQASGLPDDLYVRVHDVRDSNGNALNWHKGTATRTNTSAGPAHSIQQYRLGESNDPDLPRGSSIEVTLALTRLRWVEFTSDAKVEH